MEYSAWRGAVTGTVLWRVRAHGEQRIVPDGALDLMWFNGRLVVAGPDTTAMMVKSEPGAETFGLRFPPGVAPLLLRVSAADLLNERVDLHDLVGRSKPSGVCDPRSRPSLLEQLYVDLWQSADPDRDLVRLAAFLERGASVGAPAATLESQTGLPARSLRRRSLLLFGYGLKTLSGIRRFQQAYELVRAGTALSEVAARAGYADQAHMTREITRFAGISPARLAAPRTRTCST